MNALNIFGKGTKLVGTTARIDRPIGLSCDCYLALPSDCSATFKKDATGYAEELKTIDAFFRRVMTNHKLLDEIEPRDRTQRSQPVPDRRGGNPPARAQRTALPLGLLLLSAIRIIVSAMERSIRTLVR